MGSINNKYKMDVDITEQDCQELIDGSEFNWTFTATDEKGNTVEVDIRLFNPDINE